MARILVTAVALGAVALGFAATAQAKLCVSIDAPRTVRQGAVFAVRVTTLLPTWEEGKLVELAPTPAAIRLRVTLLGPGGVWREARLRRTSNPAVWTARLRLGLRGHWVLQVSGWESAPRTCAAPARIRVRA
jgi:hypothetical protein